MRAPQSGHGGVCLAWALQNLLNEALTEYEPIADALATSCSKNFARCKFEKVFNAQEDAQVEYVKMMDYPRNESPAGTLLAGGLPPN